jgi:hypothetical protein
LEIDGAGGVVLVKKYFLGQHHPACAKRVCALFLIAQSALLD